ncbi:MAG TPA: type 4a pilus biogenesis protein PilO, partial [Spongiibacteraceae bacterium]|nr:type 4a pilus biogenesis protein PilO [Spongiibacteraceae bacterium]
MALQDMIRDLRELDLSELNLDNIGSWPLPIKVAAWVLAFVVFMVIGYVYNISDLRDQLAQVETKELDLKKEFEDKAFKAANLEALRKQMKEMEESFGALVSQLPTDTEVPGLLEDITNKGVESGLEIKSIKLQAEQAKEFYVELPISIEVTGTYHDFGTFVSGIAGLPRIVTLHDFKMVSDPKTPGV